MKVSDTTDYKSPPPQMHPQLVRRDEYSVRAAPLNGDGLHGESWAIAKAFVGWIEKEGYASYDPYDIWGTKYGVWARRIYYEKGVVGLPLIAPILLLDSVWPRARALFVKKQRYATADAQLLLGFLNLHKITRARAYLDKAIALGDEILEYSIPGYSGFCWGYPFDWQNDRGLWRKNTPYITCTPYVFEAFLALHEATGQERYLEIAASIAKFIYQDLNDTETGLDAAAASYSPKDKTKVINASAYRAFVLFECVFRLGMDEFKDKAWRNLNFILQSQAADGSWLYSLDSSGEAFIDHFHTCFVLKNLFKLNRWLGNEEVKQAIRKGYEYYRRELFDGKDQPKSFAIRPRTQIVRLDLYNFAEAITLGALLRDEIPTAFSLAEALSRKLGERYQLSDGHFVTRVYLGGLRHTLPFLRWSQAQLFLAVTNLLVASSAALPSVLRPLSSDLCPPPSAFARSALGGLLKRKERWGLSVRGWFALLGLGTVLTAAGIWRIHPFLAVTSRTEAEVLVVEGWVPNYVLEESIAEFKSKPYRLIYTVGCNVLNGIDIEEGDNQAAQAAKRLKWLGMKTEFVQPVEARVKYRDRTYQSALALRKWLEEKQSPVTAFNLVTVGPHARRSRALFEKAFNGRARVGIIAVEDRQYDPRHWWKYSEGVKNVISETVGYLYARLIFRPTEQ